MTGELTLGKLFGIPFRLHWSWFLALFLISWTLSSGFFPETLPDFDPAGGVYWLLGVISALGLFLSIVLHELGHAVVAQLFGIPVRGIRLFVFGGVAELGSEPKKPGHEILIALGGPAVTVLLILAYNLALVVILALGTQNWDLRDGILHMEGGSRWIAAAAGVLFYLGMINAFVLIFNLIPAFPLDGGRVLRGIVWSATGSFLTSTRIAGGVGIAFSWLLFIGGFVSAIQGNLFGGLWMFFLGTFLQNAAQSSIGYAQLQQLLRGVRVAEMMRREPMTIDAGLSLRDAADKFFLRYPYKAYPVVDGGRFVGVLTLRALQDEDREQWGTLRAGEVVSRSGPPPVVHPREPVLGAMRKLAESGQSRLAVVENGQLVGLLCGRDVLDLMEIRAGLLPPRADRGQPVE